MLEVRDLIPANQAHRWDAAPWLWDRLHADVPPMRRWQARDVRGIRPAFTALRDGNLQSAPGQCGVLTDPEISRLLAGQPTRMFRAELTEKWVASLHAGLSDAAPWRLAAAYQAWREDRDALGLRTTRPVTLFGLGGMRQARKPKVALDLTPAGPILRFCYTGGSAVLPRAQWTVPPDLEAALRGWPLPRFPQNPPGPLPQEIEPCRTVADRPPTHREIRRWVLIRHPITSLISACRTGIPDIWKGALCRFVRVVCRAVVPLDQTPALCH